MKLFMKRSRKKTQREAARERRQRDPVYDDEGEETEIVFRSSGPPTDPPTPVPKSAPGSPNASADLHDMVQKFHSELGLITLDNDKIRSVCNQLLKDNQARDRVIGDLTGLVEKSRTSLTTRGTCTLLTLGSPAIPPGLDFMAGCGVIMRMQTPLPMPSQNYAVSVIHRARRSSARS